MTLPMVMVIHLNIRRLIINKKLIGLSLVLFLNFAHALSDDYSLIGIANPESAEQKVSGNNHDPWQSYNRKVFKFNEKLDKAVLKPLAKAYRKVVPKLARKSIRNVFSHVDDLLVISNDVLQVKPKQTLEDVTRFTFNSTFGVLGLFDVASHMGLPKHDEDFGQTLGRWGIKSGPYMVLPVLGPSTLRDTAGDIVHFTAENNARMKVKRKLRYILGPNKNFKNKSASYAYTGVRVIDKRDSYLDAEDVMDTFVLDKYIAIREAYLQNREYLIKDGELLEDSDELVLEPGEDEALLDDMSSEPPKKSPKSIKPKPGANLEDAITDDEDLVE